MTTDDSERARLRQMLQYEAQMQTQGHRLIAGIDEAGRGPLAGPVIAAACILPMNAYFPSLNDSKLLSPAQRERLFCKLTTHEGVYFGVGLVDIEEIDLLNIYQATLCAMKKAVEALPFEPDCFLVDGMPFSWKGKPALKIIKGDRLSQSIAAASIIAKVTRDQLMVKYGKEFPEYGFESHKGYGTPQHLKALHFHGPTRIHRRSFEPVRSLIGVLSSKEPE